MVHRYPGWVDIKPISDPLRKILKDLSNSYGIFDNESII